MEDFFVFLENHALGIFILLLLVIVLLYFIRSLAKIFGWGNYDESQVIDKKKSTLAEIAGDLLVKIINDFRHLLALILVFIFALALGYVMFLYSDNLADFTTAIQTVVSTLGGLIGSIIGYYFGESAGRKESSQNQSVMLNNPQNPITQQAPPVNNAVVEDIKPINLPPNALKKDDEKP